MRGGPAGHRIATRRQAQIEQIRKRQDQAFRFYADQRLTLTEIGRRLGVSTKTAWYDVTAAADRIDRDEPYLADRKILIAKVQRNLDTVAKAHLPKVRTKASADVILAVLRDERKLHGLDPKDDAVPADRVLGFVRDLVGLVLASVPDEATRKVILAAGRQRLARLVANPTIDLPPQPEPEKDK